ncbi:MAG TPA: DNA polymerase Y family protein [Steroidobacteraceae bacterium]|nr:DNA polymerase Y family protein [Steroidobacteraceae bacterium]
MNSLQSLLFDPPAPAVPARARRAAPPTALPEPREARELWLAVQLGGAAGAVDDLPGEAFPAALAVLVKRGQAFTPRVAVESSDAVLLELAGSRRLFGGLEQLLRALRAAFPRPLQLALAPTPLAAVLLARAGRNCCITSPARLMGRLAPLPLVHLRWPEEELARLGGMGIVTLGELLRLPRAGLARRIGPERLDELDRLTGGRPDPRVRFAPAPRFHECIDPDHETIDRERLLALLGPALARLEEFLRERQRGVVALRLRLHHRRAMPVCCILRCVVPEYRAARFAALLAARLESLALAGPVRRMELAAGRLRRFLAASAPLWAPGEHGGGAMAAQAPEFLQTLMARLGERAVHGVAQVDEHRPERESREVWFPLSVAAARVVPPASPAGAARPLGLLAVPRPLAVIRDGAGRVSRLLLQGQELTLLSGPERIESGWWDGGEVVRDYYLARTADGARWWIFREGAATRGWFVHGCFA